MKQLALPLLLGITLLVGCVNKTPEPVTAAAATQTDQPAATVRTAKENIVLMLFRNATRIEAKSGPVSQSKWSKDLNSQETKLLSEGVGAPTLNNAIPKCPPTIHVTFFKGDRVIGTMGAFCNAQSPVIRIDVGKTSAAFSPADMKKVQLALEDPTDV